MTASQQTSQPSYEFHPVADIFPLMNADAFDSLCRDIESNGLREAIWTQGGRIIDGRNRYNACLKTGVEPRYREYEGGEKGLVSFVLSLNLERRHLSESQRAMVAQQISNLPHGANQHTSAEGASIGAPISQTEAATMLSVSRTSVQRAAKIVRDGVPELVEKVETGEISLNEAEQLTEMPAFRQKRLIKKGRKARKSAIDKIREQSLKAVTKGKPTCPACTPGIADTDQNFLAVIQFVAKQFPSHARYLTDVEFELADAELLGQVNEDKAKILAAIKAGYSEKSDCKRETKLSTEAFDVAVTELIDYNEIEIVMQGGKTDVASGARKQILCIIERPAETTYEIDDEFQDRDDW